MNKINSVLKFSTFINYIKPVNSSKFIGRWTITGVSNSNDIVHKIMDRNNTDHCGVCIIEDNKILNKDNKIIEKNEKNLDYFTPFIM